jgi:hypothetical protein
MPWREVIFKADGGGVFPPSCTPRPDAKMVENDLLDLLLLERLSNDASSLATTPERGLRGSKFKGASKNLCVHDDGAAKSPAAVSPLPRADESAELPFSMSARAIEDRFAKRIGLA